jgi:PAS domain S-box-containing protein
MEVSLSWANPRQLTRRLGGWLDHLVAKSLLGLAFGVVGCATAILVSEAAGGTAGRPLLPAGLLLASWFGGVIGGGVATVLLLATLVVFFYHDSASTSTEDVANFLAFAFLALLINGFNFWRRQVEQYLVRAQLDLENRAQAEQELRARSEESEAYFRSVFEEASDAILIADGSARFLDANPAAETLLGRRKDELKGLTVEDILTASPDWTESEYRSFLEERTWRGDVEINRPDGTIVPAEAHAVIVSGPSGRVGVSVLRDISQRREMEKLRQTFLASVSHDLRNPLTSILGYAVLMQRSQTFDAEGMAEIVSQSRRLERLIGDLLDVSSMQSAAFTISPAEVDIGEIAEKVVQNLQATGPKILVDLPDEPLLGFWDGQRLEQVIENLVSNAIKYSPDGGDIRLSVSQAGDEVELSVSDQGIGIEPEDLAALFDPFHRVKNSRSSPGLGLGLYIVRMISEAHGGQVWAESAGRGKGATFFVRLPRTPAQL